MKHQTANVLSLLSTNSKVETVLGDELPVFVVETLYNNAFDCVEQDAFWDNYMRCEVTRHPSDNTPTSKNEIIAEQTINAYYRAATLHISTA